MPEKTPKVKLDLKNLAMLPSYFDYIFVHLRQKARLRPKLSPKFLSTFGPNPARKAGPTYNSAAPPESILLLITVVCDDAKKTEEKIGLFVTFFSLAAFQLGGGETGTPGPSLTTPILRTSCYQLVGNIGMIAYSGGYCSLVTGTKNKLCLGL